MCKQEEYRKAYRSGYERGKNDAVKAAAVALYDIVNRLGN